MLIEERQDELAALQRAAAEAGEGRGRAVVISGPAGIGKTWLLDATAGVARRAGLVVARAQGAALERPLSFGVLRRLLEGLALPAPAVIEPPVDDHSADALARLADQIDAAFRLVVDAAANQPLALVVDDVHWADDASVRFLEVAARRLAGHPVLLVAAARTFEPGGDSGVVDRLIYGAGALPLTPEPWSASGVRQLMTSQLARDPDPGLVEASLAATGGNPLLVKELAVVLRGSETVDAELVRGIAPKAVAWSVAQTLRHLPAAAPAVAAAIAIFEAGTDVDAVARVAQVSDSAVREVVAPMERAELLDADGSLRYAHPLTRQAVLADLPASTRARLHFDAAAVLAERGATLAAAAHLLQGPPTVEGWALDALRAAADDAHRLGDPARAVEFLDRAVAASARPDLLAARAGALAAAGEETAVGAYEVAVAAATDSAERARLLLGMGSALFARGRYADATLAASQGLELEPPDDVRAGLESMHAIASAWSPLDHSDHLTPALPARDRWSPDSLLSHPQRAALATEARRRVLLGDDHAVAADLARTAWGRGALLAEGGPDDPALLTVLTALHHSGAYAETIEAAGACLAAAREQGLEMMVANLLNLRGHVRIHAGDLDGAAPDLWECHAAREHGWRAYSPVNAALLSFLLTDQGDIERAAAVLDEVGREPEPSRSSPMWAFLEAARGRIALVRGRLDDAATVCLGARRRYHDQLGTANPAVMLGHGDAALALHGLGRTQEAVALAEEDVAAARAWGAPRALGAALRIRGLVGEDAQRLDDLREAAEVLEASGARLELARAKHALGAAQTEEDARESLREALDLAAAGSATGLATEIRETLVAQGGRPRRERLTGIAALTATERRVADLAGAGWSNADIAEKLVVTPRTVAFHLTSVYRKLGVARRSELPARVDA